MDKSGKVFIHNQPVGRVWQDETTYCFQYAQDYIANPKFGPVSQTLPVRADAYVNQGSPIPFFDGLIPEGWLLDIGLKTWKLNEKDRMELLLTMCNDCIGAVSIIREEESK